MFCKPKGNKLKFHYLYNYIMVNDFAITLQKLPGESKDDLVIRITKEILKVLTLHRIKGNKPCIIFIEGKSGEGKTVASVKLIEVIRGFVEQQLNETLDIEKQYVYTPFEYPDKLEWILKSPEAKDKHVLVFGEARNLVKAKTWFSVINQSIGDINAMSRGIKPLIFIVISQNIKDIEKDTRFTIDYQVKCSRVIGQNSKIRWYRVFMTDNIENPRLRKRRVTGTIILDGKSYKITLKTITVTMPNKELMEQVDSLDREHKLKIIMKKLDKMRKVLRKELPRGTRLEEIADNIIKEQGALNLVIRRGKGGTMKVRREIQKVYDFSEQDFRDFEKILREKLQNRGVINATADTAAVQ